MVTVNGVRFLISENLPLGPGMILQDLLYSRTLLKLKGTEKASDTDFRRQMESVPLASVSKRVMYFLNLLLQ